MFKYKVLLWTISTQIFFLILILITTVFNFSFLIKNEIYLRVNTAVDSIEDHVKDYLLYQNRRQLEDILENFVFKNHEIALLVLYDKDDHISKIISGMSDKKALSNINSTILVKEFPVKNHGNLARIEIFLRNDYFYEKFYLLIREASILALVGMFISAVVSYIFERKLIKTLGNLQKGIKDLYIGHDASPIIIHEKNELTAIIDSFNNLVEDLRKKSRGEKA